MLTPDEVRHGYWAEKWLSAKNPAPVTEVKEYQGEESLSISCTQLGAMASHQKRIVAEWCEALPHLRDVRTLYFVSRVNQRLFDAAAQVPNLEELYVKWGGIKSVARLVGSQTLRTLSLGSNPGVTDIEQVRHLSPISVLELENIPAAHDLGFLAGLGNLEALGVDGSMWTTQVVDSLEPLGSLHNLKLLSLVNTRVRRGGLRPLIAMKSLVHLRTAGWYSASEFAALRAGLPLLRYGTPLDETVIREYAER